MQGIKRCMPPEAYSRVAFLLIRYPFARHFIKSRSGILKKTIGLRVSEEVEIKGLDQAEHGIGGFEGGGFEAWAKENTK